MYAIRKEWVGSDDTLCFVIIL